MNQIPVFAGLDVHSTSITGTIKDEKGNPLYEQKIPTTPEGIKHLFHRFKKEQVTAVFEATRCWQYYAQLLEPYCNVLKVAHPTKIRAIASARIKTDKIDSSILSDLLRANLIPESYLPPIDFIQLREQLRYRASLSQTRSGLKCKLRYILACEGKKCEWSDVTIKKARLWIAHLQLTSIHRQQLDYLLKLIDDITDEISEIDKWMEKKALEYPETDILKSIPGISTYSALLILAEIVDIGRFPSADKLSSYAGLCPSTYQSSDTCYQGKITKQGSKWLRWILVQCAHASIKTRKSHRIKRFFLRIQRKKGKNKAVVATANKMLKLIWYLLIKNEYFAG